MAKKKKKFTTTHHTIRIRVEAGVIHYDLAPNDDEGEHVKVKAGETVKWKASGNLSFIILFAKAGTPFAELLFGGSSGQDSQTGIVQPGKAHFPYFAVVSINGTTLVGDPEIIVT
jgi:hypothetical protein